MTGSLRLVPLVCPTCGDDLPALEDDVAFACGRCRVGLELADRGLQPRALRLVAGAGRPGGFHLPFWELDAGTRVPAFNTREVLSLARRFSGRTLPLDRPGRRIRLVGASLPSGEAVRVARFLGLRRAGTAGRPALLAVPFIDGGSHLRDLCTGARLYRETIDRCDALVRAACLDRAATTT
ncbi:MAG: hypothetical protein PVF68_05305 [Acidobacteriota bacterium]|jgi:hypothetical protein